MVEHQWAGIDSRKFGIGNISLADGVRFPGHGTHKIGLEVDLRPLRKDGKHLPVTYFEAEYDSEATRKLIALFWQSGLVRRVLFNDLTIPRVTRAGGHDNHFHVDVIV